MKIVGLTGGIGSGKTTVATMFAELGVPVYVSDVRAKELMATSQVIKEQLIQAFGEEAYDAEGILDRQYLAHIVFRDEQALDTINSIVHPAVGDDFNLWREAQDYEYVIKESAILFEHDLHIHCDHVITVVAPLDLRIQRVIERDDTTEEEVLLRANKQWPDQERIALSDFVIENITLPHTLAQVKEIHQKILQFEG